MLFTEMDLLNQYFDKMNNNIGILCYEGKIETFIAFWLLVHEMKCLSVKITDVRDVTESR